MALTGIGTAEWVQRLTEKPGAILTRVRISGVGRIFLPKSASSADAVTVSVQPPCAVVCINICAHVQNPKHWQPQHWLDTGKHRTL